MILIRKLKALSFQKNLASVSQLAPKTQTFTLKGSEQQINFRKEIENRVQKIVYKNVNEENFKINKQLKFKQMGLDSLEVVDMVVEMQQSIGIDISNEQAEHIDSIECAVETFSNYLEERKRLSDLN